MKRSLLYLLLLSLIVVSCKETETKKKDRKEMIVGTWRAVKLENPEMDSFFTNSQAYIDTVGKHNNVETNIELYGVGNMDSMRRVLQQQLDSAKSMQTNTVSNTVFSFRGDSIVVLSFNGAVDSSRWYFDAAGILVLDDLNGETAGDKVNMEVVALTDSVLKLKFMESDTYSLVTFHPEGK
jgi:hypothetical protein